MDRINRIKDRYNVYISIDMIKRMWRNIWLDVFFPALLTLVLFCVGYHVWDMNIFVPMVYSGMDDFTHGSFLMRALHWDCSVWTDSHLGYPYEAEMYAFPHVPFAAVLMGYILGMFTDSYGLAVNIYFLMTYILATAVFTKVAQSLIGVSYRISLLGGLLYAFSFFHLAHGLGGHFTAICYGMVPFVIWLCVLIAASKPIDINIGNKIIVTVGLFVLCISDLFYAFWGCILLTIAGLYAWFNYRHVNKNYNVAIVSIVMIVLFTGILLLPAINYALSHYVQTAQRTAFEAWWWGLSLPSLFAPMTTEHNLFLSWLRRKYLEGNVNTSLNIDYLGVTGCIGFIYLVFTLFTCRSKDKVIDQLSRFNAWTIVIGLSGGIGLFIAVYFTAKVRVYDRISVYVYCFAMLAFVFLLNKLINKYKQLKKSSICFMFLSLVLVFHLFDMQYFFHKELEIKCIGPVHKLEGGEKGYYQALTDAYEGDKQVVDYITNSISPQAKVLYLPYLDFPEEGKVGNYAKAVGMRFFSKNIYVSSGNVYGTYNAELMKMKYDTDNFDHILAYAGNDGFDVIVVDKSALKMPLDYINSLRKTLAVSPVLDTKYYSVFKLNGERKHKDIESVYTIKWCKGVYGEEYDGVVPFQWARQNVICWILCDDREKYKMTFTVRVFGDEATELSIMGCGINERVHVSPNTEVPVELEVDLSRGYQLELTSSVQDKQPDILSGRMLNFMIRDYRLEKE